MKNKKFWRTFAALCTSLVLMGGFSVTAFAQGTEQTPETEQTTEVDATNDSNVVIEETEDSPPLTPEGNAALVDDFGGNKQLITITTKAGNYFYILIDRANEDKETAVHFLNQVDDADLAALTEEGQTQEETPAVCTCTEKCQAGAVNTACPVCVKNLSECVGTEQEAAEPTEPENPEPEKKSNTGAILAVLLILAAGGGAAVYFLVLKPKQGKKVPADLDDFDLEDEEEYLTEDEETEEKNE